MSAYDPPLDAGIRDAVEALRSAGIETYESCEGGPGHAYPEPSVRFHGDLPEGMRALSAALAAGLPEGRLADIDPPPRFLGLDTARLLAGENGTGPFYYARFAAIPFVSSGGAG